MTAVVDGDPPVGTVPQVGFIPSALHVVEEDVARAFAVLGFGQSHQGFSTSHHPTDHLGVGQLPAVVADRSPAAVVVDLDTARALAVTRCQSQGQSGGACCGGRARVPCQRSAEAVAQPVVRRVPPRRTGAGAVKAPPVPFGWCRTLRMPGALFLLAIPTGRGRYPLAQGAGGWGS